LKNNPKNQVTTTIRETVKRSDSNSRKTISKTAQLSINMNVVQAIRDNIDSALTIICLEILDSIGFGFDGIPPILDLNGAMYIDTAEHVQNLITKHGLPLRIVTGNSSEMQKQVLTALTKYKMIKTVVNQTDILVIEE